MLNSPITLVMHWRPPLLPALNTPRPPTVTLAALACTCPAQPPHTPDVFAVCAATIPLISGGIFVVVVFVARVLWSVGAFL